MNIIFMDLPTLQDFLHKCIPCKTLFKSRPDITSHKKKKKKYCAENNTLLFRKLYLLIQRVSFNIHSFTNLNVRL